jgi:hypothetical protein
MLYAAALHRSITIYKSEAPKDCHAILDRILHELAFAQEIVISSYGLPITVAARGPFESTLAALPRPQLIIVSPGPDTPYLAANLYLTFEAPELVGQLDSENDSARVVIEFTSRHLHDDSVIYPETGDWGIAPWLIVLAPPILAQNDSFVTLDSDNDGDGADQKSMLRQLFEPQVTGLYEFLPYPVGADIESQGERIEVAVQRIIHSSVLQKCGNLHWEPYNDNKETLIGRYCLPGGIDITAGEVVCEPAPFSAADGEGAFDMILTFIPENPNKHKTELH